MIRNFLIILGIVNILLISSYAILTDKLNIVAQGAKTTDSLNTTIFREQTDFNTSIVEELQKMYQIQKETIEAHGKLMYFYETALADTVYN